MHKVFDNHGSQIGHFNGTTVFDKNGVVLYRVLNHEIYAPVITVDLNNNKTNSHAIGKIGELKGDVGISLEDERLFTIAR